MNAEPDMGSLNRRAARAREWPRLAIIALGVALVYITSARFGFSVAFVADQVTTVWPPTGIAQAALLLWGLRLWPAIWIAAFVANAAVSQPLWAIAGIATGNTLEAVAAAWALRRLGFNPALDRTRDTLAFIIIGVVAATAISSTVGATTLCASGLQPWAQFWPIWTEWWLGDSLGSLVFAPALLTTLRPSAQFRREQLVETAAWVIAAMGGTAIVFSGIIAPMVGQFPLAFAIFPFVIAAAVRLGQPATALVTMGTVIVTLWSTIHGIGPFTHGPAHDALILAQVFTGVLAGSGLVLASAIAERRVIERRRTAAYGVSEVLTASGNLSDAAPHVLRVIGTNLDWQVGALWLVDRRNERLRCISVWCAADTSAAQFVKLTTETQFAAGVGLPGRVWATGRPAWIQDVVEDRNFPRAPIARREGLHGAFGFPIRMGGDVLGVVEFFNRAVETPDKDLLDTMGAIGGEIGQFISRKQMEATAAEDQSRTRAILETALDAIITMDHRGLITEFNPAAERMFDRTHEHAVGRELATLIIPPPLRESHRDGLRRYLETGSGPFIDRRIDTTAMRADGTMFPVEISITRVPTDPPMFTGFVRDVTDRVAAERERGQLLERELAARQQAEAANRAKDMFLATLSHELRTPLNAIVGWTRMLVDGTLDEGTASRALQIIDRNAQVQLQLVEDILEVSRIITGKLKLDVQPVDLGAIVGTVLESVRPAADARQIQLRSTVSASARLSVGDPKRLQQVVWNLISNALKFTGQGGSVEVEVADCTPTSVCIKVTDDGVGIPPEFIPHLFERFTQADSSTTRRHGGLGLGLAIVRHFVELHGGTVRAESKGPGQGATFTVELPNLAVETTSAVALRSRSGRAAVHGSPLEGCRVLLVEDDADARDLLATILMQAGAVVEVSASVDEAMAALERAVPDVLLSDIGLVGADGYTLIRKVRARDAECHAHLPAAAVTAYAREQDRQSALDAGFDRYVAKPVDRNIVETVQQLWKTI